MTQAAPNQLGPALPKELRGWSWGAFLLNWIWGIGNNTYVALLTVVPVVGWFVMPFVLGAKGKEWAWRNGRWDSVDHFRRVQRRWAIWGFVLAGGSIGLFVAIFGGTVHGSSEAYRLGVERLQNSRAANDLLGTPISTGMSYGSVLVSTSGGRALLHFTAKGPRASGEVVVAASEAGGVWTLKGLTLRLAGHEETIDLLKQDSASLAAPTPRPEPLRTRRQPT